MPTVFLVMVWFFCDGPSIWELGPFHTKEECREISSQLMQMQQRGVYECVDKWENE